MMPGAMRASSCGSAPTANGNRLTTMTKNSGGCTTSALRRTASRRSRRTTTPKAIIWVSALLATLLSLDGMFRSDFEDGSLEQMLLSPQPLALLALAKVVAHWLVTGLPLIVSAPLLGVLLSMPADVMGVLLLTLLLGTPVLSLIGAIGVALTVALRRGGALLALLVMPLYVPVLIFGAQAVSAAGMGLSVSGQLYVLGALLALAASLAPLAIAAALRISLD